MNCSCHECGSRLIRWVMDPAAEKGEWPPRPFVRNDVEPWRRDPDVPDRILCGACELARPTRREPGAR